MRTGVIRLSLCYDSLFGAAGLCRSKARLALQPTPPRTSSNRARGVVWSGGDVAFTLSAATGFRCIVRLVSEANCGRATPSELVGVASVRL